MTFSLKLRRIVRKILPRRLDLGTYLFRLLLFTCLVALTYFFLLALKIKSMVIFLQG